MEARLRQGQHTRAEGPGWTAGGGGRFGPISKALLSSRSSCL